MNTRILIQDLIIYIILLAALAVYRESIRRSRETPDANRVSRKFWWIASCLATLLMGLGVLHQAGVLQGVAAFVLFGAVAAVSLILLLLLRKQLR